MEHLHSLVIPAFRRDLHRCSRTGSESGTKHVPQRVKCAGSLYGSGHGRRVRCAQQPGPFHGCPVGWSWSCSARWIGKWVWVNTYRYIFSGMNIHLPAILMFTRGTRFWHTAKWSTVGLEVSYCVFSDKPTWTAVRKWLTWPCGQGSPGRRGWQLGLLRKGENLQEKRYSIVLYIYIYIYTENVI